MNDDLSPADAPRRPVRSYVLRAGRMGTGQQRALAELAPRFVLPYRAERSDFAAAFAQSAPLVIEIGFGMGDATAQIAAARADTNFLGIEVHPPGVGALLQRIEERGLTNVRIVQHDAVEVLEQMIAPASLAGVHIYFPDPWHKKRHNKRRLVSGDFAALAASRLRRGGTLQLATDWEPYAEAMLEVLNGAAVLRNRAGDRRFVPRNPGRILTRFEKRGERLGHAVHDLCFEKL